MSKKKPERQEPSQVDDALLFESLVTKAQAAELSNILSRAQAGASAVVLEWSDGLKELFPK